MCYHLSAKSRNHSSLLVVVYRSAIHFVRVRERDNVANTLNKKWLDSLDPVLLPKRDPKLELDPADGRPVERDPRFPVPLPKPERRPVCQVSTIVVEEAHVQHVLQWKDVRAWRLPLPLLLPPPMIEISFSKHSNRWGS